MRLMARAGNELAKIGGGICVITEGVDGQQCGYASPPHRGLMSPEPYERVADSHATISRALVEAGCNFNYAFHDDFAVGSCRAARTSHVR